MKEIILTSIAATGAAILLNKYVNLSDVWCIVVISIPTLWAYILFKININNISNEMTSKQILGINALNITLEKEHDERMAFFIQFKSLIENQIAITKDLRTMQNDYFAQMISIATYIKESKILNDDFDKDLREMLCKKLNELSLQVVAVIDVVKNLNENITKFSTLYSKKIDDVNLKIGDVEKIEICQKSAIEGLTTALPATLNQWIPSAKAFIDSMSKHQEQISKVIEGQSGLFFANCFNENKRTFSTIKESVKDMVESVQKELTRFANDETDRFGEISGTLNQLSDTIENCQTVFEAAANSLSDSVEIINKGKMAANKLSEEEKIILNRIENLCGKK